MKLEIPAISHVNIDQAVYKAIAEQIITGVLPPGARITEEEIAAKLGVSRTPVREAIKSLAKDELVELLPRRGVYVRWLSREDLNEIYEIREALEGMAARNAATMVSDEDIEKLTKQMETCRQDLKLGRIESFLEFDEALHLLILDHCENKKLRKMLNSLKNLVHYFRSEVARDRNRAVDAVNEHCNILTALKQRNPDMAEAALREHIRITRDRTLNDIDFSSSKGESNEA